MALLIFVVFGFFVGLLARAIMPGRQSMGFIMTSVLGMLGSLLGGFISSALSNSEPTTFHAVGFIGSVIGALVVLGIGLAVSRRRRPLGI